MSRNVTFYDGPPLTMKFAGDANEWRRAKVWVRIKKDSRTGYIQKTRMTTKRMEYLIKIDGMKAKWMKMGDFDIIRESKAHLGTVKIDDTQRSEIKMAKTKGKMNVGTVATNNIDRFEPGDSFKNANGEFLVVSKISNNNNFNTAAQYAVMNLHTFSSVLLNNSSAVTTYLNNMGAVPVTLAVEEEAD